ncbi:MAG: cobalamin B12-binding domain-containing protein, partial [Gemmatimonadota bacterium]|nr:cobalamin B12-binding domain-containing protein [Gemmatimonadota bacterium]
IPKHPIGVASERTGLSPDVLRVWERRYHAVSPDRSEGRQRLYSDDDIERLRLLRLATLPGRAISAVVSLSTAELERMVDEDDRARARVEAKGSPDAGPGSELVNRALAHVRMYDTPGLQWLLTRTVADLGVANFIGAVAGPLLRRVGDEWHAGTLTVGQEHLATSTVRRVVITAMAGVTPPADAPALVVATLAGERHEVGALFAAAIATAQGWAVTYLGADLPAADIADTAMATRARAVGVSVVAPADRGQVISELKTIRGRLPERVAVLAGGPGASGLARELEGVGVRVVERMSELEVGGP